MDLSWVHALDAHLCSNVGGASATIKNGYILRVSQIVYLANHATYRGLCDSESAHSGRSEKDSDDEIMYDPQADDDSWMGESPCMDYHDLLCPIQCEYCGIGS